MKNKKNRIGNNKLKISFDRFRKSFSKKQNYGEYKIAKYSVRKRVVIEEWNSDEGRIKFARCRYKNAFYRLAHHYQAQINPFFCGVACMTSVLNAMRVNKGTIPNQEDFSYTTVSGETIPYRLYSQINILNEKTDEIKSRTAIAPSIRARGTMSKPVDDFDPGLDLGEVRDMLELYETSVVLRRANEKYEKGGERLVKDFVEILNDEEALMIVNYQGKVIGLPTGGHYSIVGAYDELSDCALVLDCAAHKNPWYWVPTRHLYLAMAEQEKGKPRGWLVIHDRRE